MDYIARVLDLASLRMREERVTAADPRALEVAVAANGGRLLSARPVRRGWTAGAVSASARPAVMSANEVAVFCRELNGLVGAGLSVVEALEALAVQPAVHRASGPALPYRALLDRLRQGRSLSDAMTDVGGFPLLLVASVRSSEHTSNLTQALEAFLQFEDAVSALRRRVISASLYPAMVAGLGLLVSLFLLWVVVPRFAALYGQIGPGAGTVTMALLEVSRALRAWPWLLPATLGALGALAWWSLRNGRWRRVLSALGRHLPVLAQPMRDFSLARLYEALALLVRGGFTVQAALRLCEDVVTPGARSQVQRARAEIERGVGVSQALTVAGLTDPVTERLLRAGERGGDFADLLRHISKRHGTSFATFVERSTRLVEPLLLLAVALVVGSIVVVLYMPIFDIASSVR